MKLICVIVSKNLEVIVIMKRKIFIINLSREFNEEKFYKFLNLISKTKITKINGLKKFMDKKQSLYAQIAVKLIMGKELGINYENILIKEDSFGKPFIENCKNIYFNISHSQNIIAIGFSENPVGIDVEFEGVDGIKIAKRLFTKKENDYIKNSTNPKKAFLEIWTKKEAYVKYLGVGLKKPLNEFCVLCEEINTRFIMIHSDNYVISFYDDLAEKQIEIIEISEEEIEHLNLNNIM